MTQTRRRPSRQHGGGLSGPKANSSPGHCAWRRDLWPMSSKWWLGVGRWGPSYLLHVSPHLAGTEPLSHRSPSKAQPLAVD